MNRTLTSRAAAALLALAAALPAAGADAGKKLTPKGGAANYGENKQLRCKGAAFEELDFDLKKLVKQAGHELQADGRLCAVAEALLSGVELPAGQTQVTPPAHVVAFLSTHYGLAQPAKRSFLMDLELGDVASEGRTAGAAEAKATSAMLQESLAKMLSGFAQPRWGMASTRTGKGKARVAILMDDRQLELSDVPRRLEAGKQATVAGRVLPPFQNPKLSISDPHGQVTRPEQAPGDAFQAPIACGSAAGDFWIEVRADRDGATARLASFPVACGKELPTSVALSGEAWPSDPRGQEKRLAEGINAQRATAGAEKVEWDDALAGVAREVAEKLRDQVAKGEAPSIQVEPFLEKAGVASVLVLMNPAQAPTAAEVEGQFGASATTRQNLLNAEVNRVGVGVVPATGPGGKPAVFVVELFTKFLEKVDPAQVREKLYAEVERRRAAAGAAAATRDPKLEKVAQEYASALAEGGGTISADVADDITHPIRIAFKSIDLVQGAKPNPLDFAEPGAATAGTALGVGVAQGDSPVLGKNAVFVVLVAATPRGAEPAKAAPAADKGAADKGAGAKPAARPGKKKP